VIAMKIVHWCTSKVNTPLTGIRKYEEELYKNMVKIIREENLDVEVQRILRSESRVLGSTVFSWFYKYRCSGDVVHATSQVLAPVVYFRKPKRFVVTVHDLAPMVYPFEIRDISEKIQWIFTPKALRSVDKIIAISEFTKEETIRLLGIDEERIKVVHQGVDHELYKPMDKERCRRFFNLDPEKKYILYVASNLCHKRVDLAKTVFEEIRKYRDDVFMIKAGYSERLEGGGIINMGWIDEKDMPKLYNCADVYLHTAEYEGFGLPVLEAMACGIPVVASNKASIPEIVGDAGILVDLNEDCVKEFAESILKILDKNVKVDRKALERSMKFSWEKTARETLEVYDIL